MQATTFRTARSFHQASLLDLIASALLGLVMRPIRFYQARAAMTALGALSDHELADIGLNRLDLAAAASLPTGEDPTTALAGVVRERRRGERRM